MRVSLRQSKKKSFLLRWKEQLLQRMSQEITATLSSTEEPQGCSTSHTTQTHLKLQSGSEQAQRRVQVDRELCARMRQHEEQSLLLFDLSDRLHFPVIPITTGIAWTSAISRARQIIGK